MVVVVGTLFFPKHFCGGGGGGEVGEGAMSSCTVLHPCPWVSPRVHGSSFLTSGGIRKFLVEYMEFS